MTDEKPTNDCYADGERRAMEYFQHWRAGALGPLLAWMARAGMTANHLTLLSLLAGLAAAFLLVSSPLPAFLLLALHALLDGLDGPLARYSGTASNRGSFTDTMADQTVIAAVMLALIEMKAAGALAGGVYVFVYTLVVGFAIIRNALRIPYSWVVRPRFIVYLWLPVEFYLWPQSLTWLLWGFNLLLGIKVATGFWKIRQHI